jgi:hypothetical protein
MYRIVKRIVHTITTVTWLVRWEDASAAGNTVEKEITFPASHSVIEEEVTNTKNISKMIDQSSKPTLDQGEKS